MTRDELESALLDPNVQAYCRVVRHGESNQNDDAYSLVNGGSHFTDFTDHPYKGQKSPPGRASGAYQYLASTWAGVKKEAELPDFSPHSQDLGAVLLLKWRHCLDDVIAGRLEAAISKCVNEWTSLPGAAENTRYTMAKAREVFKQYGGTLAGIAPPVIVIEPPKEKKVPFLLAAFQAILSSIPAMQAKWGNDASVVATRNIELVKTVVGVGLSAVQASNEQDLIEKLKNDPVAVQQVTDAVQAIWWKLDTSGVGAAREADAKFVSSGARPWHSPSFLFTLMMWPLLAAIIGAIIGLWGTLALSEALTGNLLTGIVTAALFGGAGYYYGAMTSANKTPTQ